MPSFERCRNTGQNLYDLAAYVFAISGVASPKNWGGKMFDFRQITLFCLRYRFSKHKMTIYAKHLREHGPLGLTWLRLCSQYLSV